ncbi:MAG TPA: hypothetical protein PKY30_08215 [Myxococcota bacterium]|nr:hypothetical protein [Myxococcota bacterium]
MNATSQPVIVTPKLETPTKDFRPRTGIRAGDGGVCHTDNWRESTRR